MAVTVGEGNEGAETTGIVVSFFGLELVVSLAGDVCDIAFDWTSGTLDSRSADLCVSAVARRGLEMIFPSGDVGVAICSDDMFNDRIRRSS